MWEIMYWEIYDSKRACKNGNDCDCNIYNQTEKRK